MESIHYFLFESDFIEDNIRCIPMVVRMKLDIVGIKMSLAAWSRCTSSERKELMLMACNSHPDRQRYALYVGCLIRVITGQDPTLIPAEKYRYWEQDHIIPDQLIQQSVLYGMEISIQQWKSLSPLQRFALVKLCRPGHENRNFPYAMQEFGLAEQLPINALL